jgi:hypothetical protein
MDNSKQLSILGTHGAGRRQRKEIIQHRKLKRLATPTPGKNRGSCPFFVAPSGFSKLYSLFKNCNIKQ